MSKEIFNLLAVWYLLKGVGTALTITYMIAGSPKLTRKREWFWVLWFMVILVFVWPMVESIIDVSNGTGGGNKER